MHELLSLPLVMIFVLVYLFAGTIKGTLGVGLPTAAVGISSQLTDPQLAVALVVVPVFVTNAWQVYRQGQVRRMVRKLWPYTLCIWVSLWLVSQLAPSVDQRLVFATLGAGICAFSILGLLTQLPGIAPRFDKPAQIVAGASAGWFGGLSAIWAPPVVIYLLTMRLDREDFVRHSGFMLGVGALPLLAGYLSNGQMPWPLPLWSLAMIVPTLIGFAMGERLRPWLGGRAFRTAVLVLFFIAGLNLLRRAVFGV